MIDSCVLSFTEEVLIYARCAAQPYIEPVVRMYGYVSCCVHVHMDCARPRSAARYLHLYSYFARQFRRQHHPAARAQRTAHAQAPRKAKALAKLKREVLPK